MLMIVFLFEFQIVLSRNIAQSKTAVANIRGLWGPKGLIEFRQEGDGATVISGNISGLKPGLHGLHIHATGIVTAECTLAGPHYNPLNKDHGGPGDEVRHVGDLGNIKADSDGNANFQIKDKEIQLSGPYSVVGRAIVVHAAPDDLGKGGHLLSITAGNAGLRVGCGVIEA